MTKDLLADLNGVVLKKKLEKILTKYDIPLTVLAQEIGIGFPTLYSFLKGTRKKRYMVLRKIALFIKKHDKKLYEEETEHQ